MTPDNTPKPEIIYGIHSGCIYEGGSTKSLHKTKDGALKRLMELVRKAIDEYNRVYADDPEDMPIWKEVSEGHWNNGIDEIYICEKELLP